MTKNESIQRCLRAESENAELRAELETERIRLAGCGAAAMCNTEKTIAERITADNPYYSASYQDVCSAVDREMNLRAELEKVAAELTDYKNKYATMAGEVDCRTLDMVRWKERAEQADLALHIANTDKARALREMREMQEHLATEVGPGMWHLHEVDKATLAERTRCAEIANIRGLNQDCGPFPELYAYGRRIANAIAKAIMEEPK